MPHSFGSKGSEKPIKALFTTAVWGRAYIDRFLRYSLRTQLSKGNLRSFDPNSLYLLITDAADIGYVTSSEAFRFLSNVVTTECVARETIPGSRSGDKYAKLTACQNYALQRSIDFDAIFFGYADALWTDGSYRTAAHRIAEGYDAVFSFGYNVIDHRFTAAINDLEKTPQSLAIDFAPRVFARAVYENLHPIVHSNNWRNEYMGSCPSYVLWDVPGNGILLRGFHCHPVALRVRHDIADFFEPFQSTLDEGFVTRLYRTYPRIYVCPTSDEIGVCSLLDDDGTSFQRISPRRRSVGALAEFAEAHAGLLHRELFRHPIRLIIDDVCEDRWREAEKEAADLADAIAQRLAIPDRVLALEAPHAFQARLRRQTLHQKSPTSLFASSSRLFIRSLMRRTALTLARVVRALHLGHTFRYLVVPLLRPQHKQWWRGVAHEIGGIVPGRKDKRSVRKTGWFRWLWSWIRVYA